MLVGCFYSGLVGGLPFVALLACIGGLAFVVCAFGGFLLWSLPAYAFLTIASLCNKQPAQPGVQLTLSDVAATRGPAVTEGSFLAGAHRQLSVALI